MVVLTTIEQDSNTVLYSIHSGLHRPGATDASTSGTGGRQAPPHNPCTLGPRASADVQDEAGRRREIHGDHPSRRERSEERRVGKECRSRGSAGRSEKRDAMEALT